MDRPRPASEPPATSTSIKNVPSRSSFVARPFDSPEKNSVSRMTAPKSATVLPAMTSWPKSELALPESLSTGTTRPSDVADSVMAMSSGDWIRPPARSRKPMTSPSASEMISPMAGRRSRGPRSRSSSTSSPETKSRNPRPTTERTRTTRSG